MQDRYTEQQLIDAVKAGDEDRVRSIASLAPALIDTQENGVPVVRLAIYHGHPTVAQALADLGARLDVFSAAAMNKADRLAILLQGEREQVNGWSADGFTPLALAAHFGAAHAARLLLAVGADPNARSKNTLENTPLHAAVAGRRAALVDLLLDAGADVNARDGNGFTPLNLAANGGDVAIARLLLARGADATIANDEGRTPLETAERDGHPEVAELIGTWGASRRDAGRGTRGAGT